MSKSRSVRKAFTLIELLATLVGSVIGFSVLAVAIGAPTPQPSEQPSSGQPAATPSAQPESPAEETKKPRRRRPSEQPATGASPAGLTDGLLSARAAARQIKDESQIRGITQAFVIFAGNNGDDFPLPSALDRHDRTVAERGVAKDTTANIFSILISQGFVPPEMLVSPAEANPSIKINTTYEYIKPPKAADPQNALWDPAFSADFTAGQTGNTSYATMCLTSERRALWKSSEQRTPILGNRGPHVSKVEYAVSGAPTATLDPASSNTLKIHGKPNSWEGVIGFADNSATYVETMSPKLQYVTADKSKKADVLFFDEPDDASKTNAFLTITTKGGTKPEEMKWIWD